MQLWIHWVVDNLRRWNTEWLSAGPILLGNVEPGLEGGAELVILSSLLEVVTPVLVAKTHQPGGVAAQRFGKAVRRSFIPSCSQLLERIGSRAMISEPAATMIAMIATVVGSMVSTEVSFQFIG